MTEQDKRPVRGIPSWVVDYEALVERSNSENVRAMVSEWESGERRVFIEFAESVLNFPPEEVDKFVKELTTRKARDEHEERHFQAVLSQLSYKRETLKKLYMAVKEVEGMD